MASAIDDASVDAEHAFSVDVADHYENAEIWTHGAEGVIALAEDRLPSYDRWYDGGPLGSAYRRLGEIYEARGDRQQAIDSLHASGVPVGRCRPGIPTAGRGCSPCDRTIDQGAVRDSGEPAGPGRSGKRGRRTTLQGSPITRFPTSTPCNQLAVNLV